MPHKADAAGAVDELTPLAHRLGVVNCVINRDGRLVGDSTDGAGLIEALRRGGDIDPDGRKCAVIGAGGAARAAIAALGDRGATDVVVVNRTHDRAVEAAALAGFVGRAGTPSDIADAEIVIQATPSGMEGNDPEPVVDETVLSEKIHSGQVVMDLIYVPTITTFLQRSADVGAKAIGGIGMLVHQAALALEYWTGVSAPVDEMWAVATDYLAKSNTG
jgi:shikimate dehydrogenase